MERVSVPFPCHKNNNMVLNKDEDNKVSRTRKESEHNLHGACTRLREVRNS